MHTASSQLPLCYLPWPGMVGMLSTLVIPNYPKLSHPWDCGGSKLESPSPFWILRLVNTMKPSVSFFFFSLYPLWTQENNPVNTAHK